MFRSRCLLISLALPILAAGPSPALADTTLAQIDRPSPVSSFGGRVVWSAFDAGSGRYRLMTFVDGKASAVPIAPRGVPFDAELGPDVEGATVVVYSRCSREPDFKFESIPDWATGRGCDLYEYDFGRGRELKLRGVSTNQGSEFLPSLWNGTIAFGRVYPRLPGLRGKVPYLYVRGTHGGHSDRQPGGSRGKNGLPGPLATDLTGDRLAFRWEYDRGGVRTSEIRLDTLGGGHRRLGVTAGSETTRRSFTSPSVAEGRVYYAKVTSGAIADARFIRYRISTGDFDDARAPRGLISTATSRDDRDRFSYITGDPVPRDNCRPEPRFETHCIVARTDGDVPFG